MSADRREFLQAAGVAGAALLSGSLTETARGFQANDTLRVGCIGTGGRCRALMKSLAGVPNVKITAVCDTKNIELVRSLGADHVVDYLHEDFTRSGQTYDVIFDAVGKHSFRRSRRSLNPGGLFVDTDLGFMWHGPLVVLATRWIGDKKAVLGITKYTKADVLHLKELIEAGKYRAVIDRRFPLEDVVQATRYVETGQKTGNVVLTVVGGNGTGDAP